jgi:hypothetical protein
MSGRRSWHLPQRDPNRHPEASATRTLRLLVIHEPTESWPTEGSASARRLLCPRPAGAGHGRPPGLAIPVSSDEPGGRRTPQALGEISEIALELNYAPITPKLGLGRGSGDRTS